VAPAPTSVQLPGRHPWAPRALLATAVIASALLAWLPATSSGDLQSRIAGDQSAASSLQSQIAADSARIRQTNQGLATAEARLSTIQQQLSAREAELNRVQSSLLAARTHLLELENRLRLAAASLSANLVARYEGEQPDLVSVVVESHGFSDLLERLRFMDQIGRQDARVVSQTRAARIEVRREADALAALERHDRALTQQVLVQRNQVAALQAALLGQRIRQEHTRNGDASKLATLNSSLHKLQARAAAQARAATAGNANVGGIAVNTGGMVQPPAGAPPAVGEVIAAGNAIATLPYIYGGGHASFHANGYDCSGSVSYALAAAGLVSSPMVSGDFENWGDPGPGRWITIYANAGHVWMTVAGWRFDTVALAESGTRWSQGGGEFSGFIVRHPPGL
jgi:peptidoglycan hydrolase CwlO-like protein